ncbi:hypothetical protein BCU24_21090 [Vibrio cyclitrophicus]|uniref:hypothetical protein n=1 Tax=Vibrio cyclitrophicus TaxID=47951 RepID=UPI000C856F66|nr:hypothetical protein [Vibrio cyclitrophicus]PMJ21412.1 hypothetical protein BCU28_10490 [Vibrio cyclitrophicus]PMJ38242.1 hypothetical protein BCU24_21090 [Vibrio cyclitrophicus]
MNGTLLLGFLSRGISLAGNLILLPLILIHLSHVEYTIWMVFLSALSLAILLDCGFAAVISRYFTYILAGCKELPDGALKYYKANDNDVSIDVDKRLFTLVYRFANHLYILLSILLLIVLTAFWFFYLKDIASQKGVEVLQPWLLFSLSIVTTLYFNKFNAYFFGVKQVSSVYRTAMLSGIVYIAVAIYFVTNDMGLLGLALAKLVSTLFYLIYCQFEFKRSPANKNITVDSYSFQSYINVFKKIKPIAISTGIATLGAFCLNRASTFYVARYLTDVDGASLLLLMNLLSTITSVTYIYMNTRTPVLNSTIYQGEFLKIVKIQNDIYIKSLLFFSISCLGLFLFGPILLELIGSKTKLPNTGIMAFAFLTYIGELFLAISTNFLTSQNNLKYAKYVAYTGFVYIFIAYIFISSYPLMLVAVSCQFFVQLVFNFWYWPSIVLRKLYKYKQECG